eukprot:3397962-Pyramimonas_sp.AAC.1
MAPGQNESSISLLKRERRTGKRRASGSRSFLFGKTIVLQAEVRLRRRGRRLYRRLSCNNIFEISKCASCGRSRQPGSCARERRSSRPWAEMRNIRDVR